MIVKQLDTRIPNLFNKIDPGATFLSVRGYRNNFGEVSDFSVVFHFNYKKAVARALDIWKNTKAQGAHQRRVKQDLIDSYTETLRFGFNHRAKSAHAYCRVLDSKGNLIDGVKYHIKNQELHLTGLVCRKRIITPGIYPPSNMVDTTRADLMALTPLANYRQFKLVNGRFSELHVQKMRLTERDLVVT